MGKIRISERDSLTGYQSIELFFPDLSMAPSNSILIYSVGWFHTLTLQHIYGLRPDISIISQTGLLYPQLLTYPIPENLPFVAFPKFSTGELIPPFIRGYDLLFYNANLTKGNRIFVQYGYETTHLMPYLEPKEQFLWFGELKQDPQVGWNAIHNGDYTTYLQNIQRYFESIGNNPNVAAATKIADYLQYLTLHVLEYTYENKLFDVTAETLHKFITTFIDRNNSVIIKENFLKMYNLYANSLRRMGRYTEAEKIALKLIEIRPTLSSNYALLAQIYHSQNKGDEAIVSYQKASELDPFNNNTAFNYAKILAKYESIDKAVDFLNAHIAFLTKNKLNNSQKIMEYNKRCLMLEPNKAELQEGNLLLKIFNATKIPATSQ
jgi:tetratricopeptide (TPR) repeat protein